MFIKFGVFTVSVLSLCLWARAADRYEAENFMVDSNIVQKVADASASGGMRLPL